METLGVIGLGNIGGAVAGNLLAANFGVIGYDLKRNDAFVDAGGSLAESVQQLAGKVDVIVQSLPSAAAVGNAVDGLLEVARAGQIVIDISSYALADKLAQAARLARSGVVLLDCEVSGLPFMVANRSAVIFQAGDKKAIDRVDHVFNAMTDRHIYLGEFGAATNMKLFANAMVAIHNTVAAEIMNLAARSGVDPKVLIQALSQSAGGSVTFTNKAPIMVSRKFEGGAGPFRHMFGYLRRVANLARDAGASTPLLDATRALYERAEREGRADQDIAAIIELLEADSRQRTG